MDVLSTLVISFRVRGEYAFAGNAEKDIFDLGAEGCGIVVAVGPGDTAGLAVGDAVAFTGGAFAERVLHQARMCYKVPKSCPEVAALQISGLTACAALYGTAGLEKQQQQQQQQRACPDGPIPILLVTAAAGGTGHFAVQLGILAGYHVIAVCGTEEKAGRLQTLGGTRAGDVGGGFSPGIRVINYNREDLAHVLATEYPQGVDVAYEGVGGKVRDIVWNALKVPGGKQLQVGYISEYPHNHTNDTGTDPTRGQTRKEEEEEGDDDDDDDDDDHHHHLLPPSPDLFWGGKTIHVHGKTIYGQVWPASRMDVLRARRTLFKLFEQGAIDVWIDDRSSTFKGLQSVPDAIEYMLAGGSIGKVVAHIQ